MNPVGDYEWLRGVVSYLDARALPITLMSVLIHGGGK